ncbi:MAG: hypothetical protein AB7R69_03965 [Candidatus Babeliales bacterium]
MNLKSLLLFLLITSSQVFQLNCSNVYQKFDQWYYTPSSNDTRVKALNAFGIGLSVIGLLLVKKGVEQTLQAHPEKEILDQGLCSKIFSELKSVAARIGGSAMATIGLALTAGGISTIFLNKDIIGQYERYKDNCCDY